jgi:hypothetical protein
LALRRGGWTFAAIGKALGVSITRASQIVRKAERLDRDLFARLTEQTEILVYDKKNEPPRGKRGGPANHSQWQPDSRED